MVGERVERRLTAILAADVAGYSRLMGTDAKALGLGMRRVGVLVNEPWPPLEGLRLA